jgi:hypothetical protein
MQHLFRRAVIIAAAAAFRAMGPSTRIPTPITSTRDVIGGTPTGAHGVLRTSLTQSFKTCLN